jgi:dTDP-4-amino-4,6-dideoxygalactose transaminase
MSAALPPTIPLSPVLSLASFRRAGGAARTQSVLDAGDVRFVTSGRIAIALALREMGVKAGDKVLVPAWHSLSMVPPVLWLGAEPVFYRLRPDTTVDIGDVMAKLDGSTRVLMATHYFGFPQQEMATLRALCDARGIGLLEDCAHCLIGEHQGRPVGAWGDYAIASSMKFLPIYEGGLLVSHRHSLRNVALRSAGLGFEAKVALTSLEKGFAHGRLAGVRAALWLPMKARDAAWGLLKSRRGSSGAALAPDSSDSSFNFDPRWLDKRSSWFARLMTRLAPTGRIASARREHYERIDKALRHLRGGRPLYPRLPNGACPWVYPFVADDPEQLCARLRAAGVPMVGFGRPLWEGVDEGTCAVSSDLSRRVIGFPCHQELREEELAWMIGAIQEALKP